jgi:GR25 family glycosyltransferase involved in LPS biosynthesis
MKTLNEYFEEIYCINLNARIERWENVTQQFSKNKLEVKRYEAVDGKKNNSINNLKSGQLGCIISHLNILKQCYENNIENVLITEDDVEFCDDLNRIFFEYEKELPEWDILYFGANHALCNPYEHSPPIKVTDHVYRVLHAYSTHAYAVNKSCYKILIDHISQMNAPLDVMYSQIQRHLRVYLFRPHLAWQSNGYSDIMEENIDYSFLKN